jgi:P27 family predicted phage terminase small subunit
VDGRKPKPIEQRRREGNASKRPEPEVMLVAGRPRIGELDEPPEHLNSWAKAFWQEMVPQLVDVGILDRVDKYALEQLATQYGRIRAAQAAIDRFGYFTTGSRGQPREHPAVKLEREATRLFLQLAEHYALTPIARTRLGLAEITRRSLLQEMEEGLGKPTLRPVRDAVIDAVVG